MTHPKTLAVIRVFSSTDQKVLEKHAKIIEKLYGIPTRTYCIPNQLEGIANEEIAKDCVERIVEQCLRAEKDGADAVLVSCAIDPGVEAARKVCRIPIFGAGSCAAAMALTMGSRVGVLSLIAGDVPSVPRSILGDRMVAAVGIDSVKDTRDLLTDWGRAGAKKCVEELAKKVDVIMFSCTGFSTMGIAHWFPDLNVPIIDAIEAGGAAVDRYFAVSSVQGPLDL